MGAERRRPTRYDSETMAQANGRGRRQSNRMADSVRLNRSLGLVGIEPWTGTGRVAIAIAAALVGYLGVAEAGAAQVCFVEGGAAEIRAVKVRNAKVGATEIGVAEDCKREMRGTEIGVTEIGAAKIRTAEVTVAPGRWALGAFKA